MKRQASAPPSPPSEESWPLNLFERQRASLVIASLKHSLGYSAATFTTAAKRRLRTVLHMFEERGHCFDAPRSGRPTIYTDQILEAAVDKLLEFEDIYPTTSQLVEELQQSGVLHPHADHHTFITHLKEYVEARGHHLIMNYDRTTFVLLKQDTAARQAYCTYMEDLLAKHDLEDLVFVDETQLAAAPHPKGKSQGSRAELVRAVHSQLPPLQAACSCLVTRLPS